MTRCKKALTKLLFPHIAIIALFIPVSATLLIYSFTFEHTAAFMDYLSYALSAYTLVVLCVRISYIIQRLRYRRYKNQYVRRYVTDPPFRAQISLYSSLFINTAYSLFQLGLGLFHRTVWYYTITGYYAILAVMRYILAKELHRKRTERDLFVEHQLYRFCGILLLLMNLALGVIIAFIVWQNRGFEHHYITTIAMAVYTFVSLVKSIVNVIKYRKYESPVLSASKAICLAAALVSVLTLETAILSAFGKDITSTLRRTMILSTGAVVSFFVLTLAVSMIVHSTKELNRMKPASRGEQQIFRHSL